MGRRCAHLGGSGRCARDGHHEDVGAVDLTRCRVCHQLTLHRPDRSSAGSTATTGDTPRATGATKE